MAVLCRSVNNDCQLSITYLCVRWFWTSNDNFHQVYMQRKYGCISHQVQVYSGYLFFWKLVLQILYHLNQRRAIYVYEQLQSTEVQQYINVYSFDWTIYHLYLQSTLWYMNFGWNYKLFCSTTVYDLISNHNFKQIDWIGATNCSSIKNVPLHPNWHYFLPCAFCVIKRWLFLLLFPSFIVSGKYLQELPVACLRESSISFSSSCSSEIWDSPQFVNSH